MVSDGLKILQLHLLHVAWIASAVSATTFALELFRLEILWIATLGNIVDVAKQSVRINSIDAIYILCSYTYGPLLGLFAFALLTRRTLLRDRFVPVVAIASPVLCFLLNQVVAATTGYQFGYELLMLNGALTFAGLWLLSRR